MSIYIEPVFEGIITSVGLTKVFILGSNERLNHGSIYWRPTIYIKD